MASYTAKQLNRANTPIEGLTAGESYVFSITNNTSTGTAYFTVETADNSTGSFSGKPTNALGLYSGFDKINENSLVTSSYVSSVVVTKGVGSYTFTPTVDIAISSSFLRATGGMTLNLSPSIYSFFTTAELQTAVDLWISDNAAALATYGGINTWNTTAITDMSSLFSNKTTFNSDISNWDVSNVTNMSNMFRFAELFNQPLNNWDVRNVTEMRGMFRYANAFQQPLNLWQLNSLTGISGEGFMGNTGALGAITYNLLDTLYNGWVIDLAALQNNLTISFGNSTFTAAGLTAKNILVNDKGWTITDGGQV